MTEGTAAVSGCRGTRRRGCRSEERSDEESRRYKLQLTLPPLLVGEVAERSEVGGVVVLRNAATKNLKKPKLQPDPTLPQGDNSDGRLQITDGRYRDVRNRRPLQCHSERSEESRITHCELHIDNPSTASGPPPLQAWEVRVTYNYASHACRGGRNNCN